MWPFSRKVEETHNWVRFRLLVEQDLNGKSYVDRRHYRVCEGGKCNCGEIEVTYDRYSGDDDNDWMKIDTETFASAILDHNNLAPAHNKKRQAFLDSIAPILKIAKEKGWAAAITPVI